MFASRMTIARVGRAAAAPRQFASLSGARAYLPKFSTVAAGGTVLVVGGASPTHGRPLDDENVPLLTPA